MQAWRGDAVTGLVGKGCLPGRSWKGAKAAAYVAAAAAAASAGALFFLKQVSTSPPHSPRSLPSLDLLTLPGLRNTGSNCFLNAVLQALASSPSFLAFVASHAHSSIVPMPLAMAVLNLLEELSVLTTGPRIASPRRVIIALAFYARNFDFAVQQDAAEALVHLASAFKVELLECFKNHKTHLQSLASVLNIKPDNYTLTDMKKKESLCHPLHIWMQQSHWPMEGTLGSSLTCQACGFQYSTRFEFFDEVPLSPPWEADGTIIGGCTVQDCLRLFTDSESISDFKCSNCSHLAAIHALLLKAGINRDLIQRIKNCNYDDDCTCKTLLLQHGMAWRDISSYAFKKLRVGCCPEVLCLNLQRSVVNGDGDPIKLKGHILFPKFLNLFPFTFFADTHSEFEQFFLRASRDDLEKAGIYRTSIERRSSIIFGKDSIQHVMESARASVVTDDSIPDDMNTNDSNQNDDTAQTSGIHASKIAAYTELPFVQRHDVEGLNLNHVVNLERVWRNFPLQGGTDLHVGILDPTIRQLCKKQALSSALRSAFTKGVSDVSVLEDMEDKLGASSNSTRCLYELISVVVHYGSHGSGHYMVYRRVKLATDVSGKVLPQSLFLLEKFKKRYNKHVTDPPTAKHQAGRIFCRSMHSSDEHAVLFNGIMNPTLLESISEISSSDDGLISLHEDEINIKSSDDTGTDNVYCSSEGMTNMVLWFRVSDSLVEKVTEEEVFMSEATLLFYERCDEIKDF